MSLIAAPSWLWPFSGAKALQHLRDDQAAHEAEERARAHAQEVTSDAQDAARGVSGASTYRAVAESTPPAGGGQPIVFGPFTAERPELLVAAAFVGGFLLAKIIRGIAS